MDVAQHVLPVLLDALQYELPAAQRLVAVKEQEPRGLDLELPCQLLLEVAPRVARREVQLHLLLRALAGDHDDDVARGRRRWGRRGRRGRRAADLELV